MEIGRMILSYMKHSISPYFFDYYYANNQILPSNLHYEIIVLDCYNQISNVSLCPKGSRWIWDIPGISHIYVGIPRIYVGRPIPYGRSRPASGTTHRRLGHPTYICGASHPLWAVPASKWDIPLLFPWTIAAAMGCPIKVPILENQVSLKYLGQTIESSKAYNIFYSPRSITGKTTNTTRRINYKYLQV